MALAIAHGAVGNRGKRAGKVRELAANTKNLPPKLPIKLKTLNIVDGIQLGKPNCKV